MVAINYTEMPKLYLGNMLKEKEMHERDVIEDENIFPIEPPETIDLQDIENNQVRRQTCIPGPPGD